MELHTNTIKLIDEFQLNRVTHSFICVVLYLLKDKQLIGNLFIHDKDFTRDDGNHLIVWADLHGDDLIWLSTFGLE